MKLAAIRLVRNTILLRAMHTDRIIAGRYTTLTLVPEAHGLPVVVVRNMDNQLMPQDVREFWLPAVNCIMIPLNQPSRIIDAQEDDSHG